MTESAAVATRLAELGASRVRTTVLPQRFDVHEIARFESFIDRIIAAGTVVVVDASKVRYMDRSAMDCLIGARLRCMNHGGDLYLAAPSVAARVILELSARYEALNPIEEADGHTLASLITAAA